MKRIWMRVGMDTQITDKEYAELIAASANNDQQKLSEIFIRMFYNGVPSGESYILGKADVCGLEDYDNPQEEISIDI